MVKALADRLAEAFAEFLHKQARIAWGFGREENLSNADLIREKYRGIRPAPGYPACPDHAEKRTLFDLLGAEKNIGIKLTGIVCDASGSKRQRILFFTSGSEIFRCRPDRTGSSRELCDPARRNDCRGRETARVEPRLRSRRIVFCQRENGASNRLGVRTAVLSRIRDRVCA